MSIYKGSTLVAGGSTYHPNIFDTKWSDHLINDIQWLRGDTFSWQDGTVYTTAYNKLVEEYATGTEETEGDITFKRSANGFKIADSSQESAILSKYNTDGIAWYYILDTTNTRFKLPRTKFGFEGLRDNVGDDIAESLPNITGSVNGAPYAFGVNSVTGAFSSTGHIATNTGTTGDAYQRGSINGFTLDASRSSSTYQDGAPVQERATQMYLYFYVGEYSQTAIEQTAGITTEQLNAKVDTSSLTELSAVLIETYVNGTSGYNIWSNGYCEQWGIVSSANNNANVITFIKTFADTNYNITTGVYNYNTSSSGSTYSWVTQYIGGIYSKSTMGVSFYGTNDMRTAYPVSWKVSGYLAEGQY